MVTTAIPRCCRRTLLLLVGAVAAVTAIRSMKRRPNPSDVRDLAAVTRLYDRVAPLYDLLTTPYLWIGAGRVTDEAIRRLELNQGDTVVDLGTGTGRNLIGLSKAVGPVGRVIGIDISPEMLEHAAERVERSQCRNITLIEADIAAYQPPAETAAVLATYSMEMLPNYGGVIARLTDTLPGGARIVLAGMREPARWPEWLIRIGSALNRPFGVNPAYRSHRPWESVEDHLDNTTYTEEFAGAVYTASGTIPHRTPAPDMP